MQKYNKKDALGQEIVFGKIYGYSQSRNGFTDVRIGEAIKFTQSGLLTLKVLESKRSLYNDELEIKQHSGSSTVKPAMLFPIN